MARFVVDSAITTTESLIVVDAGLPAGRHLFQLVVEDEAGNRSRPDRTVVTVQQRAAPTVTRPSVSTTPPLRPRVRGNTRRSRR
jgi:hypothetical protein